MRADQIGIEFGIPSPEVPEINGRGNTPSEAYKNLMARLGREPTAQEYDYAHRADYLWRLYRLPECAAWLQSKE